MKKEKLISIIKTGKLSTEQMITICKKAWEESWFADNTYEVWDAFVERVDWVAMPIKELSALYKEYPGVFIAEPILKTGRLSASEMLAHVDKFDDNYQLRIAIIESGKLSQEQLINIVWECSSIEVLNAAKKFLDFKSLSQGDLLKLLIHVGNENKATKKLLTGFIKLKGLPNNELIELLIKYKDYAIVHETILKHVDFSKLSADEIFNLGIELESDSVWDIVFDELQKK